MAVINQFAELKFTADTSSLKDASRELDTVKTKATSGATGFKTFGDAANDAKSSVLDAVGSLGKFGLAAGVVVTAAAAAATAIYSIAKASVDAADELNDMSQRTNIATERLSVLQAAASLSAGSLDEMLQGAEALATKLAKQDEETGKVVKALDKLGVSTKTTSGEQKSALQVQEDIIVAADQATNKQEAEAAAVAALGSAYYKLRGTVLDTKQAKEEMYDLMSKTGGVVTTDLAKRSGDLNDKLDTMKVVFGGIGTSIAKVALPALERVASVALATATTVAQAIARILGTEAQSTTANRALDDLRARKKAMEDQLAKANPESVYYDKLKDSLAAVVEQERELVKWQSKAMTNEQKAKEIALTGAAGEGIGTGSGVDAKVPKEKKAKTEKDNRLSTEEIYRKQQEAQQEFYRGVEQLDKLNADYRKKEEDAAAKKAEEDAKAIEANKQKADSIRGLIDPNFEIMKQLEEINKLQTQGFLTSEEAIKARETLQTKIIDEQATFIDGWKSAFDQYSKQASSAAEYGKAAFTNATTSMTDALANFVMTGKLDFKSLAASIIADLARIAIQAAITGVFKSIAGAFGGGASYGNAGYGDYAAYFSSAKATGGGVESGKAYLVGDQGPEILRMGNMGGSITPNSGIGGSTTIVNNITVQSSGADQDADKRQAKTIADAIDKKWAENYAKANRPGGMGNRVSLTV